MSKPDKDFTRKNVALWLRSYIKECDTEQERFDLEVLAKCVELGHVERCFSTGELAEVEAQARREKQRTDMAVAHAGASKAHEFHGQGCEFCENAS